ncbi:MAG: carbon-nitrogen hydrolase family protein [Pseudomonadota bacterium]
MSVATAAYPLDPPANWDAYAAKATHWVRQAADAGAELLVFPEYAGVELAFLDGPAAAADLRASIEACSRHADQAENLWISLGKETGTHILAPSAPVIDANGRPVNRAVFVGSDGLIGRQDKQIMTPFERDVWGIAPGGPLRVFDTPLGRIGVLICYDAEFPPLARALIVAGAEIILIPSCTDTGAGHARVRTAAAARALEGQCVCVVAATTGAAPWCPPVDENVGAAGIFGPADLGFPETGVICEGARGTPGWVMGTIDRAAIARVRAEGAVRNHAHWPESEARAHVVLP